MLRAFVLIAGVAGCSRDIAGGAADGPAIFASACAPCHGPAGKPPEAMATQLGVRDLTAAEFRVRATPALVEHQVRAGSDNKRMPAFEGALTDAQIQAVALFVLGLGAEPPASPR